MSATLTWFNSGFVAKTGTTNATLITDMAAVVDSKLADANFAWRTASSSTVGPMYIVLKRKDGSAGRILVALWVSLPAGNNAAILDTAPFTSSIYLAYFPAGNVDTPSNLTAASGTIMGDDTGAVKCGPALATSTIYAASFQVNYFDSQEAVIFNFQNPANSNSYGQGAGYLVVDGADNAYPAVYGGTANQGWAYFATSAGAYMAPWTGSAILAGTSTGSARTNYGSNNRVYFNAWQPSAPWAAQAISSTDILTDTANNKAWFVPVQLLGQVKGEGFALKLRQIAFGPATTGPFVAYQTSGPVVQARQLNGCNTGGPGMPWLTNFKL